MKIGNHKIGLTYPPFIIAEMSGNHNQSLDNALKIVKAASQCGAHAIKLQTYTPDTMTLNLKKNEFMIKDKKSLWAGETLYSLYKKASTPWSWHTKIFKFAKKNNILCFSSPFDETSVDFLESINAPCYKIASSECVDLPLIKRVAKTKKPIIISTGMASKEEISEALEIARSYGTKNIALLKCTSTYPAPVDDINLKTISHMRSTFGCEVGLSDHSIGIGVAVGSVCQGATLIEKHFTLSKSKKVIDSSFSLRPKEFDTLVRETMSAWKAIGTVQYGVSKSEKKSVKFRRSIYIIKDIKKGEKFTKENIKSIRPGLGLQVKYYEKLLGKLSNRNLKKGTPMKLKFAD